MDDLVAEYPDLVSKVNIGSSFENRPMNVLKVHTGARAQSLAVSGGISVRAPPAERPPISAPRPPAPVPTGPRWFGVSTSALPPTFSFSPSCAD